MIRLISAINHADRLYTLARRGEIPFLILQESLCEIGAYNITPTSFSLDGITLEPRSC